MSGSKGRLWVFRPRVPGTGISRWLTARLTIKAACFKNSNYRIRFKPSDGLSVRVQGRLSVYEPRGEYQLAVESLEPVGEGALRVAFQQIKAKLEKEGLFSDELKPPSPRFPRKIGVVTSPTGRGVL